MHKSELNTCLETKRLDTKYYIPFFPRDGWRGHWIVFFLNKVSLRFFQHMRMQGKGSLQSPLLFCSSAANPSVTSAEEGSKNVHLASGQNTRTWFTKIQDLGWVLAAQGRNESVPSNSMCHAIFSAICEWVATRFQESILKTKGSKMK